MLKRAIVLLVGLTAALLVFGLSMPLAQAIGEVTPTPVPANPQPTLPAATPLPTLPPAQPDADTTQEVERLLDSAITALQNADYAEVIALTTQALELDPRSDQAYLLRGVAYRQQEDNERALADFSRAIEVLPYGWTYYVFRAETHVLLGNDAQALVDYETAMEINPRYQEAFQGRSALLSSLNSRQEAEVDSLIAQGLARMEFGDFPNAIEEFTEAISLDGGRNRASAYAYYNRALASYQSQDLESALADYGEALEIFPDMHDSYLGRGIAYRESGDVRAAGRDFLRRIEILEANTTNLTLTVGDSTDVEMAYGNVYRITFSGLGGDSLAFEARDVEGVGVDPLIVVLDPSGAPLGGDDDFGGVLDAAIESIRLPADGTYTLVVSHANGGYDGRVSVTVRRAVNA